MIHSYCQSRGDKTMTRTILVPLDGSTFAEHALPVAIGFARRIGAGLELVIVDRPPIAWVVPEVPIVLDEAAPGTDGQRYLEELRPRLPADFAVRLTRFEGNPTAILTRHIDATEPVLIVMSTHGRGGFSRFWIGSVADGVARRSSSPTILLKPPASIPDFTREQQFANVLIPLDGSVASEEILDQALALFGTEVDYTVCRVVSPLAETHAPDPSVTAVRRQETHPEALLHAEAERLRARGAQVTERLLVNTSPANAIIELASTLDAGLIAMTTHARRGVSRFVMGSVADKVLRAAPCPVLMFHPTHEVVDVRKRVETATASAGRS